MKNTIFTVIGYAKDNMQCSCADAHLINGRFTSSCQYCKLHMYPNECMAHRYYGGRLHREGQKLK